MDKEQKKTYLMARIARLESRTHKDNRNVLDCLVKELNRLG